MLEATTVVEIGGNWGAVITLISGWVKATGAPVGWLAAIGEAAALLIEGNSQPTTAKSIKILLYRFTFWFQGKEVFSSYYIIACF